MLSNTRLFAAEGVLRLRVEAKFFYYLKVIVLPAKSPGGNVKTLIYSTSEQSTA
ncbi:hypothetical protein F4826_004937 [Rahnella inusitata]|nr:hypothetical protein [Rahnella inusitata]